MNIFNKFSKKSLIGMAIALVAIILNFFTPLFSLFTMEVSYAGKSNSESYNSYDIFDECPPPLDDIEGWLNAYTIIVLVVTVLLLAFFVFCVLKKDAAEMTKISLVSIAASGVLSVIYFINGLISVAKVEDYLGSVSSMIDTTTAAFVPLIFVVVLCAAFFAVLKFMPDDAAPQTSESANEEN